MNVAFDKELGASFGAAQGLSLQDRIDLVLRAGTQRLRLALCKAGNLPEATTMRLLNEPYPELTERRGMTPVEVRAAIDESTERSRRWAAKQQEEALDHLPLTSKEYQLLLDEIILLWQEKIPLQHGMDPLPLYQRRGGADADVKIRKLIMAVTPANSGRGVLQRVSVAVAWWREKLVAFYSNPYFNGGRPGRYGTLEWLAEPGDDGAFTNWHKFCAGHYYLDGV